MDVLVVDEGKQMMRGIDRSDAEIGVEFLYLEHFKTILEIKTSLSCIRNRGVHESHQSLVCITNTKFRGSYSGQDVLAYEANIKVIERNRIIRLLR